MKKTPLRAIKDFCIECMGGYVNEVKTCTAPNCPLFDFRLGKNPYLSRNLSEEQKIKNAERLKKYRFKKAQNES